MYSVGVVVGVVGGGRQSFNLRDRPCVLRLEAQTNRIRTVEKKLGGDPRLHRLHFELAGEVAHSTAEKKLPTHPRLQRLQCSRPYRPKPWDRGDRHSHSSLREKPAVLAWGKREERQSHGSELLGAVRQKTAFAERESLLPIGNIQPVAINSRKLGWPRE